MIDLRKKDSMIAAIEEILQQEALKGNQHKIDKNKNNKIDAEDFKLLRKEDNVEEGIKDIAKKAFKALTGGSDEDQRKDLQRKMGVPQTGKKPTQKEEVELDEGKEESKKDFDDRQKRLAAASAETAKDPKRLERMSKIPGYSAAMDLAKKTTKEEVEQIDELSKSTLGSYIKKAAADSTISRKIGADFENRANSKRSPAMKDASTALSDKFKSDSRKRKANVDKAVDRLTKEEVQGKTLKQFKENAFDWKKKPEPQPSGGSGVKQGSRYGGSKQKDKPEQETDEKK